MASLPAEHVVLRGTGNVDFEIAQLQPVTFPCLRSVVIEGEYEFLARASAIFLAMSTLVSLSLNARGSTVYGELRPLVLSAL